jgi:sugar phosphate isomerase/epimerase
MAGPKLFAATGALPPIVAFSKVYQELKLDFAQAAELTGEVGLDGIDCPVRPGGEILPEHAADELPRYVEVLRKHGLQMPLLTSGITSVASPQAETILRVARKLGVQYYRLGFINRDPAVPWKKQLAEVRSKLNELAALNREIGIGALFQNHSSTGQTSLLGGNLEEMVELVDGFAPNEIGVAFDIGHALVMHGEKWRGYFDQLKPHFSVAYVKDVKRPASWVPFGQGEIAGTGYFKLLKSMGYHAPISLHIEFDWHQNGKTRAALAKALKESSEALRGWLRG